MTAADRQTLKPRGRVPVIGLVGGMGSGKSLVAAEFGRLGARIVSGDQMGHEALREQDLRMEIIRRWGNKVLGADGQVDRAKLGPLVFGDLAQLRVLESLVFPY